MDPGHFLPSAATVVTLLFCWFSDIRRTFTFLHMRELQSHDCELSRKALLTSATDTSAASMPTKSSLGNGRSPASAGFVESGGSKAAASLKCLPQLW